MPYIEAYDGHRAIGRFDLPDHLRTERSIYRIGYALRQGGNGVVFQVAAMEGFQQFISPFALKIQKRLDANRVDRFDNEVRVLRECNHANIAAYRDHGDLYYLGRRVPWVILALGGENLRRHVDANGPLAPAKLKAVGLEVCSAIRHLHRLGFIHRDIKPDNFVWKDDSQTSILMIDFGIAKRINEDVAERPMDNFTQVTEFVGPVFFSSPELIAYATDKAHPVAYQSDYFQIGKLLWYFGTGRISAGVPAKKNCPFGGALQKLVVDLVADEPEDRPQTIDLIEERIERL